MWPSNSRATQTLIMASRDYFPRASQVADFDGAVGLAVAPDECLAECPKGALVVAGLDEGSCPLRLSVVIPTFNERRNVQELIRQLADRLDPVLSGRYELIVVDDDSPDSTWQVTAELAPEYPQLRVIRRQGERGLSTAVIRGWQIARGQVLAVIDGDLQHPPEVLTQLWKGIDGHADLAVASRNIEGGGVSDWRLTRRIVSRGAQLLGLVLLPGVLGRLSDPMSGYFMVRRSAIAGILLDPLGYKILVEVVGRGRIRSIDEIGYIFRERAKGESKVTWRIYIDYLRHLVRLRLAVAPSRRFYRFVVVGASGALVDMLMLFLLSDPRTLGLGLTRSKVAAAELALIDNFIWNDAWTFRDLTRDQNGWQHRLRRFAKFNVICGIGLALNVVLLNVLFNLLDLNRYVANAVAIGAVMAWNYRFNVMLGWRDTAKGAR
jgi:dolichol-phosphate mannosyltransferase